MRSSKGRILYVGLTIRKFLSHICSAMADNFMKKVVFGIICLIYW